MSLKRKTVSGLLWSFIDQSASQGISFIVGIILARLLMPEEFGLIGMIAVFMAVSESFINSGFSSALIRKKNCTNVDYSTVFYFNLTVGFLFFLILYFTAPGIAAFFDEPQLTAIVQVMSFVLIIDSLTLIQKTILTKRIDFKLQTRISIIASLVSGTLAVAMAFNGFGVWSLVAQRLCRQALNSLLLWMWNRWRPLWVFSKESFMDLFSFGSNLLISGLIGTLFQNIYYLVIGKYFSAAELGFYTRADEFKRLSSNKIMGVITRVSYPVLASMQDNKAQLKANYRRLIRGTVFITFLLMLGMVAVAEPMILTLIGEKWRPVIIYLQMLGFVGMMYPLNLLNLNMLQVSGRSDLVLRLSIIRNLLTLPTIILGIFWGIKAMIAGMMVNTLLAYYLNSYWSGRFVGYSFWDQVRDVLPSLGLALLMCISVYGFGWALPLVPLWKLVVQVIAGVVFVFVFCEATRFEDYMFVKSLALEKVRSLRVGRK